MILLIMRHGAAEDTGHGVPGQDVLRRLTKDGLRETSQVSKALDALKLRPTVVLSSPLVRAVETAECAVKHLKRAPDPVMIKALAPGHSWKEVQRAINQRSGEDDVVLIVGHQPDMGGYIVSALGFKSDPGVEFPLDKSACVALEWPGPISTELPALLVAITADSARRIVKGKKKRK